MSRAGARRSAAAARLPRPGAVHGPYPQSRSARPALWLALADRLGNRLTLRGWSRAGDRARFLAALDAGLAQPDSRPGSLLDQAAAASRVLVRDGFTPAGVAQAQIVAAAAIAATLGQHPYRGQHLAAFELLNDRLVELDTGEGKSLAVLLAAVTAALARVPTHVITANEYLAERDAAAARRVLATLGLSAAAVHRTMDPDQRRAAYACDVAFATAQEIGFDYLRDRQRFAERGPKAATAPVLRGLCLALIDEADSVLLDHAQTPLILAEQTGDTVPRAAAEAAWRFACALRRGPDHTVDLLTRRVDIDPRVLERLPAALVAALPGPQDRRVHTELLRDALVARHVLQRDVHYVVQADEVVLIDATTGRTLPGTAWSRGLHRMVYLKEGLAPPAATRASMQITLQTLFARYLKLAGVSGTLRDSRWALWYFYRLDVRRVASRMPSQRQHDGVRVYARRADQLAAVATRVRACVAAGRAVLVGTDSVAAADVLSRHLAAEGIAHQLLTARDDWREAELIAGAGAAGAVTVATNIAGRGTDIAVPAETRAAGGLHVICCAQNGSARIDRQLFGRTARNGACGSCETILSLDDSACAAILPAFVLSVLLRLSDNQGGAALRLSRGLSRLLRAVRAWNEFLRCRQLVRHDLLLREALVFAPHAE